MLPGDNETHTCIDATGTYSPEAGVLDEPSSAQPAQQSSHIGPPGYIRWTRPM
jgi:hypothetical protein